MPGISAIFYKQGRKPISAAFCSRIRDGMLHFPFYSSRQIIAKDGANIGLTGYAEYPVTVIDTQQFNLVLEGRIYNIGKDAMEQTLETVAKAQIACIHTCSDELRRFLLSAEGEFIITIYDKAGKRVLLANDVMGRLPLYWYEQNGSFIFSRELKFIIPFMPEVSFDRNGILEYLLYGFPFAENTLVEKVRYLPGATMLCYDMTTGTSVRETYHILNINDCAPYKGRMNTALEMKRLFMEALARRADWVDPKKTIVSLSGGLDSRATLAGLKKLGIHPVAVTAQSDEEHSAREVAKHIGADVYAIPQGRLEKQHSFADMVFLKDGLDCHPNLAQLYQNLQDLRDRFGGDIVYFTGIFGGETTRHSHPTGGLPTSGALVRYLLHARDSYKYSTAGAAAIMQISQDAVSKHLLAYLETFPEKNMPRKYLRFRHEYDGRFAGEAEDRNRYYFWTISPFFASPFFRYVMRVDENRKTTWLFRDFLFSIDPNTCRAAYFNYRLPLDNPVVLLILAMAEGMTRNVVVKNTFRLAASLVKACRRFLFHSDDAEKKHAAETRNNLDELLKSSKPAGEFFANTALPELIRNEDDIKGLERLHIVSAYIDRATRWHARFCAKETGSDR